MLSDEIKCRNTNELILPSFLGANNNLAEACKHNGGAKTLEFCDKLNKNKYFGNIDSWNLCVKTYPGLKYVGMRGGFIEGKSNKGSVQQNIWDARGVIVLRECRLNAEGGIIRTGLYRKLRVLERGINESNWLNERGYKIGVVE